MATQEFTLSDYLSGDLDYVDDPTENSNWVPILDGFESRLRENIQGLVRQMPSVRNPQAIPIELRDPFAERLGFEVPQIRKQTEQDVRRQLGDVVSWIKTKGLEISLRSYFNSIGYFAEAEILFSDDYDNFIPFDEVPAEFDQIGMEETPHVQITFSPFESIGAFFLDDEIFEIIEIRLDRDIYPVELVPHYQFEIPGYVVDDEEENERYEVIGSVTENWKKNLTTLANWGHQGSDDLLATQGGIESSVELINQWEVGYSEGLRDVAESNSDSLFDLTSNDIPAPLFGGSELTLDEVAENQTDVVVNLSEQFDQSLDGETVNYIAFYEQRYGYKELLMVFVFPDVEILHDRDYFGPLEMVFRGEVHKAIRYVQGRMERTNLDQTVDGVRTGVVGANYDPSYDEEAGLDRLLTLDQEWSLDQDSIGTTQLATLREESSYYWIGNSGGEDFPSLQANNLPEEPLARGRQFDLHYNDDLSRFRIEGDLVINPVFGEPFDRIVLYDSNDDPLAVMGFDPIEINDQFERTWFRINYFLG